MHFKNEFGSSAKLPDGKSVIQRMMNLTKKTQKGEKQLSAAEASKNVAQELRDIWIEKNVYPLHENNVAKKIKNDYEQFKNFCNQFICQKTKKTQQWYDRAEKFDAAMTKNACNIITHNKDYQKKLEDLYGVKMQEYDELYYEDNFHGEYNSTRQSSVSRNWSKKKKREDQRRLSAETRQAELGQESERERTHSEFDYGTDLASSSLHL